jgi:hypothetical protein
MGWAAFWAPFSKAHLVILDRGHLLKRVHQSKSHFEAKRQCRVARWFIFKPKIPTWVKVEGLVMDDVGHLSYFTAFWYILWSFGIFYENLVHFLRFGMLYLGKSGNPASMYVKTI